MKGISLPVNIVVGLVVVALVLVVVSFFFTTSATSEMSRTDATKIFSAACVELKCGTPSDLCKENLAMGYLHTAEFKSDFFRACNVLYGGDEASAFLCFENCGNCLRPTGDQLADLNSIRDNALQNIGSDPLCLDDLAACADKYCAI